MYLLRIISEHVEISNTDINSYRIVTEYIDRRPILALNHSNLESVTVLL